MKNEEFRGVQEEPRASITAGSIYTLPPRFEGVLLFPAEEARGVQEESRRNAYGH